MKMILGLTLLCSSFSYADVMSKAGVIFLDGANQVMRECREAHKKSGMNAGKVVIDFTIDKIGEVTEVGIDDKKSTIHDSKLHSCILKYAPGRFPMDANGKERILTATMDFP